MKFIISGGDLLKEGAWYEFCRDRQLNQWAHERDYTLTESEISKYGLYNLIIKEVNRIKSAEQ